LWIQSNSHRKLNPLCDKRNAYVLSNKISRNNGLSFSDTFDVLVSCERRLDAVLLHGGSHTL
jgi:hypothetical protein